MNICYLQIKLDTSASIKHSVCAREKMLYTNITSNVSKYLKQKSVFINNTIAFLIKS